MGEDGAESIAWRYWLLIGGVFDPFQSFLSAQLDERRLEGRERRENEREIYRKMCEWTLEQLRRGLMIGREG